MGWFIFVDAPWMAYVFALWHGLSFGAQLPLQEIAFADYFGRWSIGAIRGITAPMQFGLNAVGPLAAANMPPGPCARLVWIPATCRAPACPRNWKTDSSSANMPYMPVWQYDSPPPLVFSGKSPPGPV